MEITTDRPDENAEQAAAPDKTMETLYGMRAKMRSELAAIERTITLLEAKYPTKETECLMN